MTTRRTAAADVQAAGADPQRVSGAAVEPRQGLPSHRDLPGSGTGTMAEFKQFVVARQQIATLEYALGVALEERDHLRDALEGIAERSSYPINPRDAFDDAIDRAREALASRSPQSETAPTAPERDRIEAERYSAQARDDDELREALDAGADVAGPGITSVPPDVGETPDADRVRRFAAAMLRQYDRLAVTKQTTVTGTLLCVQDYEMEAVREWLSERPAVDVTDWLDRFAVSVRFGMDDDAPCEIDYCDSNGNTYHARGANLTAAVLAAKPARDLIIPESADV